MKFTLLLAALLLGNVAYAESIQVVCGDRFMWGFVAGVNSQNQASAYIQSGYSTYGLKDCKVSKNSFSCQGHSHARGEEHHLHKIKVELKNNVYSGQWSMFDEKTRKETLVKAFPTCMTE